jgi:tryptophan synthase alpha chain
MATQVKQLAESLRARGDIKLIPYLMAGYPSRQASIEMGRAFAAAGAAAIEVGVPYSDPLADGPTIQRAGQVALEGGMSMSGALEVAAGVASEGVPVVMMTYVNPILAYDARRFAADAAAAGVAGVIVPDLPPEESVPTAGWLRAAGLDTIFLVAPTSTEARIAAACRASSGFVYCVTLTGVTGTRTQLASGLEELISRVRGHTALPVAAGFGISRPEHLNELRGRADAAVVASALVEEVHQGRDPVALFGTLVAACR